MLADIARIPHLSWKDTCAKMPCSRASGSLSMLYWSNSDTAFIVSAQDRGLALGETELAQETRGMKITDS